MTLSNLGNLSNHIGCSPFVVQSYISILAAASENKKTITEIASIIGESHTSTGKKIAVLRNKGLVYQVFGGRKTYTVLTDSGKEFLKLSTR